MPTGRMHGVLRELRRAALLHEGGDLSDDRLLDRFLAEHDETAFEALVRRHGPMVMGVCRRVLHNAHDAEDAFQATFLVLVRKAASIVPRALLANWLYGVAYRTALGARTANARRRAKEREMPRREALDEDIWSKLRPLLDHELSHLPDKYRVPIVLCDLEGKSRKDAARQLGWLEGTLSGRLARARVLLAKRLAARGLALSGGALASSLSSSTALAGVPTPLVMSTVKAATLLAGGSITAAGVVPVKVAVLVHGVLRAMMMTKVKIATVWLLAAGVVGGSVGLATYPGGAAAQSSAKQTPPALPAPALQTSRAEEALPIPKPSVAHRQAIPAMPSFPRRVASADVLDIQLVNPSPAVPQRWLGKHTVDADGKIEIDGQTFLTVRHRTIEQTKQILANLMQRWYLPGESIDQVTNNLRVGIGALEPITPQPQPSFCIELTVIRVEHEEGNGGGPEVHKVLSRPSIVTWANQEAKFCVGNDVPSIAGGGFLTSGIELGVTVKELQNGRLRLESEAKCSEVVQNDAESSRVAFQGVRAADVIEPGDPIKIDLRNDKGELRRYAILKVTKMGADAHPNPAALDHPVRVGSIKVVGNTQIHSSLILQMLPFGAGDFLTDAALRRAEKNLVRLGFFEVDAAKKIRPTIAVVDAQEGGNIKDVVVTVREK
jgi:RNA polymerase sigma factor (sigma-70 family)